MRSSARPSHSGWIPRVSQSGSSLDRPLATLTRKRNPTMSMKQIEYKHVRHAWKLGAQLSQEKFDETLMKMLAEHGREGWDLKGVIYEGGLHAHFIFGREAV